MAGQAVCRHWRSVLRSLPLDVCIQHSSRKELLQWLVTQRPAVARLELGSGNPHLTQGLAAGLLHSLAPQVRGLGYCTLLLLRSWTSPLPHIICPAVCCLETRLCFHCRTQSVASLLWAGEQSPDTAPNT